jgi:hypothetical protein
MFQFQQSRAIMGTCDVSVDVTPTSLVLGSSAMALSQIRSVHINHSKQIVITVGRPVINDIVLEGSPESCEGLYCKLYHVCHWDFWSEKHT